MAVGGTFRTVSAFDDFYFGIVNGRGWICIALAILASWRPGKALLGARLFAALGALQVRMQQVAGSLLPCQFFLALSYVLSIAAMVVMSRRATCPKALLLPFRRGDRIWGAKFAYGPHHGALANRLDLISWVLLKCGNSRSNQ